MKNIYFLFCFLFCKTWILLKHDFYIQLSENILSCTNLDDFLKICLYLICPNETYCIFLSINYFFLSLKSKSSTSKWSVEFGGILGGDPRAPYAYYGEHIRVAFSPFLMLAKPSSHPFITCPCPRVNLKGLSRLWLESNYVPF